MTWTGLLPTPASVPESQASHNALSGQFRQGMAQMLMSCVRGFPANQPPALAKEKALRMTDGSGRRCLQRFRRLIRDGSSWKMSLVSSLLRQEWYSSSVALIWKLKGTKFNRCLFQLAVSVPRTNGNGCGLLATPMSCDSRGSAGVGKNELPNQIAMLPTPTSRDHKSEKCGQETGSMGQLLRTPRSSDADHGGPNQRDSAGYPGLPGQIAMLPTPQERSWKSGKGENTPENSYIERVMENVGKNTGTVLRLEPAMVEWMMGYPEGWTELQD